MIGCRGNVFSNISKINVLVSKRNFAENLKDFLKEGSPLSFRAIWKATPVLEWKPNEEQN